MTVAPTTEQDFAARMGRLSISQEFLAQYVGLSQPEISKLISGVRPRGEGHRKIKDALKELESIAVFFAPMKPPFEDPAAVKAWLHSPRLPNLFALLSNTQLLALDALELTRLNAVSLEGDRLEEDIAAVNEESQKLFLEWLENPSGR